MIAIILVFLEHFPLDLTSAKEVFETAIGSSDMFLKFLYLLFFSKKQPFMIYSNNQLKLAWLHTQEKLINFEED